MDTSDESTIRLIYNLPRCGGTIILRCLASMDSRFLLLSEANARGLQVKDPNFRLSPLLQMQAVHGYLEGVDIDRIPDEDYFSFPRNIEIIRDDLRRNGKSLVIRDWTYLDFLGVDLIEPSYELSTGDSLAGSYTLLEAAIVRHPVMQYESIINYVHGGNYEALSIPVFLKGYGAFTKKIIDKTYVRYEDFLEAPDRELHRLCDSLNVAFDPDYKTKWQSFTAISGDNENRDKTTISPGRTMPEKMIFDRFSDHPEYREALDMLEYEHMWAGS